MSGETQKDESGWSVDTLKAHIDQRFIDNDKAVALARQADKEAVLKAEVASEKRFESVNEFRGQLSDQTATFIPRKEADSRFEAMTEKVTAVTDRLNISQGAKTGSDVTKADLYRAVGVFVGVIGLAITILVLVLGANNG